MIASRFGAMLFPQPVEAFTNLHRLLAPGGTLGFVCWQAPDRVGWNHLPAKRIAMRHRSLRTCRRALRNNAQSIDFDRQQGAPVRPESQRLTPKGSLGYPYFDQTVRSPSGNRSEAQFQGTTDRPQGGA